MENYKEKYETALANMRKFRDALNNHEEIDLWVSKKDIVTDIEYYFPELKENEDMQIMKEIAEFIYNSAFKPKDIKKKEKWLTWLEKQGDKLQGKSALEAINEVKVDNQNCVKSANEVEPKFKVGNWITNGEYIWKVISVSYLEYTLQNQWGKCIKDTIDYVNEAFYLWTIKDARDGDVLVVPPVKGSEHSEQIFIFKEIKDREYVKNAVEYYCRYMDNEFVANERGFMGQSDDYFVPATKEQRDLLFSKMKEVGYEWDAEKKKLKKVGKKSVERHEEDEQNLNACLCYIPDEFLRRWLMDAIYAKYDRPSWSEDDIRNIENIDSVLFYDKSLPEDTCVRLRNWLKYLKQRIGE